MFVIGKILKPHGLNGDLRVYPTTDDPSRFELLEQVEVRVPGSDAVTETIERVWYHKGFVMLKFKGVQNARDAEAFRNAELVIPDELALPLEENEYYSRDLYGMSVYSEKNEELGVITGILQTGANDVYVVRSDTRETLVPAIKQCVLSVEISDRRMVIDEVYCTYTVSANGQGRLRSQHNKTRG
jgi:16S rRNA processing protein RimM